MSFQKLLLASAIATLSTSSFAMQSLDDATLAETTGQDGLTINIDNTNLAAFDVVLHDKDGFTTASGATRTFDGGIKIDNIDVTSALDLTIDIDAGSETAAATANNTLQIKVYNLTAQTIDLGAIRVGNSQRDDATVGWNVNNESADLIDLGSVTLGATSAASPLLNIHFGTEQQLAWMKLTPTFTGGLTLTGFKLKDGSVTTAGIGFGSIKMVDTGGGANLGAVININGETTGLGMTIAQLGTAAGGMDIQMDTVRLGELDAATPSTAIGDIAVLGLNLNGTTLSVVGH